MNIIRLNDLSEMLDRYKQYITLNKEINTEIKTIIECKSYINYKRVDKLLDLYIQGGISKDDCIKKLINGDRRQQREDLKKYIKEYIFNNITEYWDYIYYIIDDDICDGTYDEVKKMNKLGYFLNILQKMKSNNIDEKTIYEKIDDIVNILAKR